MFALSIAIAGQCPNNVVECTPSCGVNVAVPFANVWVAFGATLIPSPVVPSGLVKTAGSIRLPSWRS